MYNYEDKELRKAIEDISSALININFAIQNEHDKTRIYELQLAEANLQMSQKLILYGLS